VQSAAVCADFNFRNPDSLSKLFCVEMDRCAAEYQAGMLEKLKLFIDIYY